MAAAAVGSVRDVGRRREGLLSSLAAWAIWSVWLGCWAAGGVRGGPWDGDLITAPGSMAGKDSPKKAAGAPKGQKRARATEEKAEKGPKPKITGAQRIAADLAWTAQQYAKYEVFRQEQKELKAARMWSPSKSQRAPAKLEFKQRLDTTGPAAESTVVDTLVSMGFTKEQAETAAKSTKGRSLEDAAAFLLGGAAARAPRRGR